ncbi:hypothetical protein ECG_07461 [Echinococcus granulosus]|nr:hypothetical protein ECG_07461 [Echinococcus granulosus]
MLKEKCEQLVVEYESLIEEWFFDHHDETSIVDYLCRQRLLKNMPLACLDEPMLVESSQEGSRGVSSVPSHEPSSEDGAGSKEQAEYSNARPLTEL